MLSCPCNQVRDARLSGLMLPALVMAGVLIFLPGFLAACLSFAAVTLPMGLAAIGALIVLLGVLLLTVAVLLRAVVLGLSFCSLDVLCVRSAAIIPSPVFLSPAPFDPPRFTA